VRPARPRRWSAPARDTRSAMSRPTLLVAALLGFLL
jgi:hypothetical protein